MRRQLTSAPPSRSDRGSTLLLVPVGVVIVTLLGGLTLDAGRAFAVQRSASSDAVALANDLAVVGVDAEAFQLDGSLRLLDAARLDRLAYQLAAGSAVPGTVTITRTDDLAVTVTITRAVDPVMLPSGLGLGPTEVTAIATGTAVLPEG